MKRVLGIIPARLGSTRLPGKMILDLCGKALVVRTWEMAKGAKTLDRLIIATDDIEIKKVCENSGAEVMMTPETINSGSDRVAYAARKFKDFKPTVVVNIQGDEPLMPASAIDDCVKSLLKDKLAVVATPATEFVEKSDIDSPNFVKVVLNKLGHAIYFSRSKIPYPRDNYDSYLKHLGLYAYKAEFLQKYSKLPQTKLELAEKLEQLRILENGYVIKVVCGKYPNMEVNTLEEFERAKKIFASRQ